MHLFFRNTWYVPVILLTHSTILKTNIRAYFIDFSRILCELTFFLFFVYTTFNIPIFCQYYIISYYMNSDTQKEIVQNQYDCIGGKRKANDWENLIANWHVYLLIQRKRSRCYCIPVSIALVRLAANAIILHKLKKFAKPDHYNVIEKRKWIFYNFKPL